MKQSRFNWVAIVLSIVVFVILGVFAAWAQVAYEQSYIKHIDPGALEADDIGYKYQQRHTMISYSISGAALGLIVGLLIARPRQITARPE